MKVTTDPFTCTGVRHHSQLTDLGYTLWLPELFYKLQQICSSVYLIVEFSRANIWDVINVMQNYPSQGELNVKK